MTSPNGVVAGSSERQEGSYGNDKLSVGPFGLWPNGTVIFRPGGPGFMTSDGALGMKFGWTRGVEGNRFFAELQIIPEISVQLRNDGARVQRNVGGLRP